MITGIIVSYNTTTLLRNCVQSFKKYYPNNPLIIIDGSPKGSQCFRVSQSMYKGNTIVKNVEYNIGHGNGMKLGITMVQTSHFALIDSDTVIKGQVFEQMEKYLASNVYGVGKVVKVDKKGNNDENGIHYLHPYFAVINKQLYLKHLPIIHHGAPMLNAMISLSMQKEHSIINFSKIDDYVLHLERGTRVLKPTEFHPKTWQAVL